MYFASNEIVLAQAQFFATGLANLDVPRGSRILVKLTQRWESVALIWACLGMRLVPIPISPDITETEIAVIRADLEPGVELLTWESIQELSTTMRTPFDPIPRCRPIHLTSGTTGRPKGVWSGWWTSNHAKAALAEETDLWQFTESDTNLVISPLYHSAPLRFALNTVISGGNLVVPPRFEVAQTVALVNKHSPTTMFCVPTHLKRLLENVTGSDTRPFRSFRLVVHAGAPCPTDLKLRSIEVFGIDVLTEFYGSTEGQFTICPSTVWVHKRSGVGFPRENRSMFVDDSQQLWCVVPPWATFEYFGDSDRTESAWQQTPAGPAFTVGDLGRIDSDGWVHIDARRTDLIISGGVNIYPREIESILEEHPKVTDCAVVGRPHSDWGQECVAVVVGTASQAELLAHAAEHLSRTKIPKHFIFVTEIPHTATGKTQRHVLIDQVSGTAKG